MKNGHPWWQNICFRGQGIKISYPINAQEFVKPGKYNMAAEN